MDRGSSLDLARTSIRVCLWCVANCANKECTVSLVCVPSELQLLSPWIQPYDPGALADELRLEVNSRRASATPSCISRGVGEPSPILLFREPSSSRVLATGSNG